MSDAPHQTRPTIVSPAAVLSLKTEDTYELSKPEACRADVGERKCDHNADVACSADLDVIANLGCVVGLGWYLAGREIEDSSDVREGSSAAQEASPPSTQEVSSTRQAGDASEILWTWRGFYGPNL